MQELEMRWARSFRDEMERQERETVEKERLEGIVYTTDQMLEKAEENVRLWKVRESTCKLCGIVLKSPAHMEQHKDSLKCRKKQAENKGETYTPENQRPVHCEVCDRSVQRLSWDGHLQSQQHRTKVLISRGDAFKCTICDWTAGGKRRKQGLQRHMKSQTHLRKLDYPQNRATHDALCKLYGFELNTNALVKACRKKKIKVV